MGKRGKTERQGGPRIPSHFPIPCTLFQHLDPSLQPLPASHSKLESTSDSRYIQCWQEGPPRTSDPLWMFLAKSTRLKLVSPSSPAPDWRVLAGLHPDSPSITRRCDGNDDVDVIQASSAPCKLHQKYQKLKLSVKISSPAPSSSILLEHHSATIPLHFPSPETAKKKECSPGWASAAPQATPVTKKAPSKPPLSSHKPTATSTASTVPPAPASPPRAPTLPSPLPSSLQPPKPSSRKQYTRSSIPTSSCAPYPMATSPPPSSFARTSGTFLERMH